MNYALLILRLLDIVAVGMKIGPEAKAKYDVLKAKVEDMVKSGREPTATEFDELMAESTSLHGQIQAEV